MSDALKKVHTTSNSNGTGGKKWIPSVYNIIFSGISNSTGNVNFEEKNCNWDYR